MWIRSSKFLVRFPPLPKLYSVTYSVNCAIHEILVRKAGPFFSRSLNVLETVESICILVSIYDSMLCTRIWIYGRDVHGVRHYNITKYSNEFFFLLERSILNMIFAQHSSFIDSIKCIRPQLNEFVMHTQTHTKFKLHSSRVNWRNYSDASRRHRRRWLQSAVDFRLHICSRYWFLFRSTMAMSWQSD